MEKHQGTFWKIGLLIVLFAFVIAIMIVQSINERYQENAIENAEVIYSTMSHQGYLPWNVEDYRLRAVLQCPNSVTIFVTNNKSYSSELLNCSYWLAGGVELDFSNAFLSRRGTISFLKEPPLITE